MKRFELNGKEFMMPTDWKELTLKHYVDLALLEEQRVEYLLGELYLLKVIEVLCQAEGGDLDELTLEMVAELSKEVSYLQVEPTWSNTKSIEIEGTTYGFPQDLNKLTMGEYISIKTLQENSKSQAESIPYILSVILRPARLVKDMETGKEHLKQDKFDAQNIEWRKELFLKQPVYDLMGPINFFLNGNGTSLSNTEVSTEKEQK